jgi:hypothetical protein
MDYGIMVFDQSGEAFRPGYIPSYDIQVTETGGRFLGQEEECEVIIIFKALYDVPSDESAGSGDKNFLDHETVKWRIEVIKYFESVEVIRVITLH